MKKCCSIVSVVVLMLYSVCARAACDQAGAWRDKLENLALPGTITVAKDAAIGSTFYEQIINFPNQPFAICTAGYYAVQGAYRNGWIEDSMGIAPTNVPGVGVRISFINSDGSRTSIAKASKTQNRPFLSSFDWVNNGLVFELVKTSPIAGGALATGQYAALNLQDHWSLTALNVTGSGVIVPSACSVLDAAITVPMGSVHRLQFSGIGSTALERTFDISLDCDASSKVSVMLDGNADSSGVSGVLALNAQPDAADGVGLQVLFNGTPVTLGTAFSTGTTTISGPYLVTLSARYYQTKTTITGGRADSTATFTITYN